MFDLISNVKVYELKESLIAAGYPMKIFPDIDMGNYKFFDDEKVKKESKKLRRR